MSEESDSVNYLSTDDILAVHELIVESNEETEPGICEQRRDMTII